MYSSVSTQFKKVDHSLNPRQFRVGNFVAEERAKTIDFNSKNDTEPAKSGTHSEIIFAKTLSENKSNATMNIRDIRDKYRHKFARNGGTKTIGS